MPRETVDLVEITGQTSVTFSSGVPFNDLEYTLYDNDFQDGETSGFDTFMPVDPSDAFPGSDTINLVRGVGNTDLNLAYSAQDGDRIILGTAEIATPFFARGEDGQDNDYAVISNFDYENGYIQLHGAETDYELIFCGVEDGCENPGYFLFWVSHADPDLIAFIFPCDDIPLPVSGNPPNNPDALCNADGVLELSNQDQFRFAEPVDTLVYHPDGRSQFGTPGKEIIGGLAVDQTGAVYVMGQTDGNLDGRDPAENEIFVTKVAADGATAWTTEVDLPNGALLFDGVTDDSYLYAVGRTFGALPGFSGAGRYDGIILKIELSTGEIVASDQFGNPGLDGYGNVILDDAGNLFVSAQGSPADAAGTDPDYLLAKHRASDLSNVWRVLAAPNNGSSVVSEAWGGLSYIPSSDPGDGTVVTAGWFFGQGVGGAGAFVETWTDLNNSAPQREKALVIDTNGTEADWILDNTVDPDGNIYVAGFTTGSLDGPQLGNGDAYILKLSPDLDILARMQVGTPFADAFRKLDIDSSGRLYASGYTYGDYAGLNADWSNQTGDIFVQVFDLDLNPLEAAQFGTPHEERGYHAVMNGGVYIAGMTEASLVGPSNGSFDGFVIELDARDLSSR